VCLCFFSDVRVYVCVCVCMCSLFGARGGAWSGFICSTLGVSVFHLFYSRCACESFYMCACVCACAHV